MNADERRYGFHHKGHKGRILGLTGMEFFVPGARRLTFSNVSAHIWFVFFVVRAVVIGVHPRPSAVASP